MTSRALIAIGPEHNFDDLTTGIELETKRLSTVVENCNRLIEKQVRRPALEDEDFNQLRVAITPVDLGENFLNSVTVTTSDVEGDRVINPYATLHWTFQQWLWSGALNVAQRRALSVDVLNSHPMRIIARVEVGMQGPDTRFIVTNLKMRNARILYEDIYCRRGEAENHIKSWKTHLAADRTSCMKATANQFRLFLHAGAYWFMWGLRVSMPKRLIWRVAQFDTLRLRLIKIAARIVEMKTQIRLHLPTSCPAQSIMPIALARIPRPVT